MFHSVLNFLIALQKHEFNSDNDDIESITTSNAANNSSLFSSRENSSSRTNIHSPLRKFLTTAAWRPQILFFTSPDESPVEKNLFALISQVENQSSFSLICCLLHENSSYPKHYQTIMKKIHKRMLLAEVNGFIKVCEVFNGQRGQIHRFLSSFGLGILKN